MSDIILAWLNDEIQLSRRISHFEEDFNNGYLFGELLQKYNQQLNFNEFQNRYDFTNLGTIKSRNLKIFNYFLTLSPL
jgi:hypothetical protein